MQLFFKALITVAVLFLAHAPTLTLYVICSNPFLINVWPRQDQLVGASLVTEFICCDDSVHNDKIAMIRN